LACYQLEKKYAYRGSHKEHMLNIIRKLNDSGIILF